MQTKAEGLRRRKWFKIVFLYLLINLIFSIFLKEERDRELMTSLSSERFSLEKKETENFLMFVRQ